MNDARGVHDTYVPAHRLRSSIGSTDDFDGGLGASDMLAAPPAPAPESQPIAAPAADARVTAVEECIPVPEEPLDAKDLLFVHFIPPPLRENGKRDLPWIVHSAVNGCCEAKHVNIHSIAGFSTYEGQPPEQIEGKVCSCPIANHHLRGYGAVRWEGQTAIIEHHGGGTASSGGGPLLNMGAYREEQRRQGGQLAQAKAEIKRLRETVRLHRPESSNHCFVPALELWRRKIVTALAVA